MMAKMSGNPISTGGERLVLYQLYCISLLYQLVKPFIQSQSLNDFTTFVRQKRQLVIGKRQWEVEAEAVGPPMSEDEERCHVCMYIKFGWGRA